MTKAGAKSFEASAISRETVPEIAARGAVLIEDIQDTGDEAALFHLLNLVREQRLQILLTTDRAPGDLPIALPDFRSRLKALPFATIEPPDDALLRAVLVKLFADRQLSVEPQLVDYVLVRMERSMLAAERFVAAADRRALALQRRVTRAVAAATLDALGY
ncbi:MAG: DnaA/Hda family protein [Hyphomicrobium sp.]